MSLAYLIITIVIVAVAVLIGIRILLYADLARPAVAAPLLIVFSYGLGKYVGKAGAEIKNFPRHYNLEKRSFYHKIEENDDTIGATKTDQDTTGDAKEVEKERYD